MPKATSESASSTEDRAARRQRILAPLPAQAAPLLEQLADTLTDAPDRELFRAVEVQTRDLGQSGLRARRRPARQA